MDPKGDVTQNFWPNHAKFTDVKNSPTSCVRWKARNGKKVLRQKIGGTLIQFI